MNSPAEGKRALITGAGRGIGLGLARAYAGRGWRVLAAVRGPSAELDALAAGGRVAVLPLDVGSNDSARQARALAGDEPIDVLINNAGLNGGPQRAPGMDLARAEQILSVNALGPLRVYDAFVDLLRRAPAGKLVNISSDSGSLGAFRPSGKPEYAMSKAALNALTLWQAAQEPSLVCVSLHPGWVRTAIGGQGAELSPDEAGLLVADAIERLERAHSGRFLTTDLTPLPW